MKLFSSLFLVALTASGEIPGIHLADKSLRVEFLDSDEKEFFISQTMDLSGRLFVGCREALYVYEPVAGGGFGPRRELYRFPKDSWLYDLEVYGNDLFVLTNTALYVRVGILPGSKGEPCIDEFEVLAPGVVTNLALTGKATASSLLPGFAYKHQIAFLNDGVYGNGRSWIPAKSTGWAQIKLGERAKIDRIVLSRDREGELGDRTLVAFDVLVSNDGTTWKIVKKVRPSKAASVK